MSKPESLRAVRIPSPRPPRRKASHEYCWCSSGRWRELSLKEKELAGAREELKVRLAELAKITRTLDQETKDEETAEKSDDAARMLKKDEHSSAAPAASANPGKIFRTET